MKRYFFLPILLSMLVCFSVPVVAQLVENGDGTVTDIRHGLMWLVDASLYDTEKTWTQANDWINDLNNQLFADHDDWRLPKSNHPNHIYGEFGLLWGLGINCFEMGPFLNIKASNYWTSDLNPNNPNEANAFYWGDAALNFEPISDTYAVWAVRDVPGGPSPAPVDVWIRDCTEDDGTVPSNPAPCEVLWKSPDIFIDNNGDLIIDMPAYNADNRLYTIVRNKSQTWAMRVKVRFWYLNYSTGLPFPEGAELCGPPVLITVPPNSYTLASQIWYDTPPNPSDVGDEGHWCIIAQLEHDDDPYIDPYAGVGADNNLASINIGVIAQRAGDEVNLSFNVGSGGRSGFGLKPWPRQFVIEVNDSLPQGWIWSLDGIQADVPFTLKLGEERPVALTVRLREGESPHTGGFVDVRQIDVETNKSVGGVYFNIYEDHFPPKQVEKLKSEIINGRPVLSWDRVKTETETNLAERVRYYEIIRNRKVVKKVALDEDPDKEGMQWMDLDFVGGKLTYSVRAVDEGGNTVEIEDAPSVTVNLPKVCGLFNWLTWVLIIIIVILLIIIVFKKRS